MDEDALRKGLQQHKIGVGMALVGVLAAAFLARKQMRKS